ncbi:hypothetical protein PFICI_11714 [Pestalotiopsis fici W106-1]|uniref:Heterokaryon incompatibility domain-containing protein n=1 Tax=Pestalotiopsis fici (strain W106-1 / CGMCC3.15140) TaxID=1229662 RepID=W3WT65_PESFW|nr:uncharacterized protein PFICI_11714 [Pestalotiopsis fici W106-1]ETS76327.1 hypothetical protein PFICI_11714 [Pestalotiopsis fici W106-1]
MCEDCFHIQHVRNPGHQIGRTVRTARDTSPTASPRSVESIEHDRSLVLNASPPSRDNWRCCTTCFNFTPDFITPTWEGAYYDCWWSHRELRMSHFKASAAKGCELCSIVYRGALKAFADVVAANSKVMLWVSKQKLSVKATTRGTWQHVDFHTMPGFQPRWNTLEPKEYLSRSLQDSQCFDKIRKWLRVCETTHKHPKCRQRAESPLPRRVITIQPTDEPPKLCLYETDGATEKYIALSHCWGGFKGCQSTTSNYTDRIKGIEFASLPRTFREAVIFALEIGVFNIWIDSLCIVQDDKDDWERESAKMADIYSNAYLVLAAASAEADDKGFFTVPDIICRGIGLESQEGSARDDLVMHTRLEHDLYTDDMLSPTPLSPISRGPLGTRAWTLQETLLARRCIGFNENEIAWECFSAVDCECGESRETSASDHASKNNTSQIRHSDWVYKVGARLELDYDSVSLRYHCRPLSRFDDISTTYLEWRMMIIPIYTRRRLTVPGDKLPALSALACSVGKFSGDQYLAGIWLADIRLGLAWRVGGESQRSPSPAPSTWVGPSFSWASVDGEIDYLFSARILEDGGSSPFGFVDVNVLDYGMELSGLNPYGAVKSGWIKLSALSQTFKLEWDSTEERFKLINESEYDLESLHFQPDTVLCKSHISGPENEEYVSVLRSTSRNGIESSLNASVQGAFVLDGPVESGGSGSSERSGGSSTDSVGSHLSHDIVMVVLSLFSTCPDKYQRIGLATASLEPESVGKWLESATRKEFIII